MFEVLREYRRAFSFLPRYRRALILGYACLLPSAIPDLAAIRLLQVGIDRATGGALSVHDAVLLGLAVLGCSALYGILRFGMRWYLVGASRDFERDLREAVFARLLAQPAAYFAKRSTGDLVSRMTADVEAVRMTVGPGLMYVANTITVLPVALAMMAYEDWRLMLWVLLPMLLLASVFVRLGPAMQRASDETQSAIGAVDRKSVG